MEKIFNVNDVNYIVSTEGKIYSTKNIGRGKYHQEIKQRKNNDGYMMITTGKNGNRKSERVHRIVAKAFIPNPDNLPEVDHINHNKTDNRIENLRWISSFDNKSRIPFNVRSESHKGERNGRAKIKEQDVIKIRKLHLEGIAEKDILKMFNYGKGIIHNVIIGKTWKGI